IQAISQNEAAMGVHKDVGAGISSSTGTSSAGSSSSNSTIGGSSSGSFSFSSPPTHTSGFVRSGDQMPPIRSGQGGFAKRSIANLRSASNSSNGNSAVVGSSGANGNAFYPRKSSMNSPHVTPDFGGVHAFGSPPAPSPRSLSFADGPNNGMSPAGGNALNGSFGGGSSAGGAVVYMRPFARLVTDEVEKVRQEIRERERLERELRDREQAIERQKNERTKMLKRQLKEQQQRRAKNEPLLKMANLMNKVGNSGRDLSVDGGSGSSKGVSTYGSLPQMNGNSSASTDADSNRLSSASTSSNMRPRGPALPNAKPANVINLINSTITVEQGYTKRDFVFRIVTEEGG
ncbi:hypothetical protein LPJ73_008668, partial [Coemansia sp. RSA 2703]